MDKPHIVLRLVLIPHGNSPEVLYPRVKALNLPALLVSPKFSSILCGYLHPIAFVWRDHLDVVCLLKRGIEWIRVICFVSDKERRSFFRKASVNRFLHQGDFASSFSATSPSNPHRYLNGRIIFRIAACEVTSTPRGAYSITTRPNTY